MEGEDPLQLAIHGSRIQPGREVWQGLEEGRRNEIPSRLVAGGTSRPRRGPRAEEGIEIGAHTGGLDLYEEAVGGGRFQLKVSSCSCKSWPRGVSQTEATLSLSLWDGCPGNQGSRVPGTVSIEAAARAQDEARTGWRREWVPSAVESAPFLREGRFLPFADENNSWTLLLSSCSGRFPINM